MSIALTFDSCVQRVHALLDGLPDHRRGTNTVYAIKDAVLGAFAMFFTQSPSFLAHQRRMQDTNGQSNAQTLFGIGQTPTDPHIRNLLDPLAPTDLFPLFSQIRMQLDQAGALAAYRDIHDTLLVPLDGTQYFLSQQIQCPKCSTRTLANGTTHSSHTVIPPMIVKPGLPHVIPLEPVFIEPQDGATKQDCEQTAAKRWITQYGAHYAAAGVTLLGDDLSCHQPLCQLALDQQLHFIFVCKPDSHVHLYEWLAFFAAATPLPTLTQRHWNGRFAELWTYRFVNNVPLRADADALLVNWCELVITHQETGEQRYHNTFVTRYELTMATVAAVVGAGRARWKTENEGNNVLKNRGYHFEHNFGHGKHQLASTLLTLNLLAFLFHTALHLVDTRYQVLRAHLAARQTFFNDVQTLTRYLCFTSWEHLLTFMMTQLELSLPPPPT